MSKRVTKDRLLRAFERLCEAYGVESAGFEPDKITAPIDKEAWDGKTRWAIKHVKGVGYLVVCGWKGCGIRFGRWNGYIKNAWDFLMLLEILHWEKAVVPKLAEPRTTG